jgi:hypothetical protein
MLIRGPLRRWEIEQDASETFHVRADYRQAKGAEIRLGQGEPLLDVCRALAISEQTFCR